MTEPWRAGPYANDTYMRSLAQSSGDVMRQTQNARTETEKQRKTNSSQTWKVPVETANILRAGKAEGNAGLAQFGVAPSAAYQQNITDLQQAYVDRSGLLRQGLKERKGRQNTSITGIAKELQSGLREKGVEYAAKREAEMAERAHQEKMAAEARALQLELAQRSEAMQRAAMAQSAALEQQRARVYAEAGPAPVVPYGSLPPPDRPGYMKLTPAQKAAENAIWNFLHPPPAGGRGVDDKSVRFNNARNG